jgi:hypothetical protein
MADGLSISMLTGPFNDSMDEWNHAADKATMYALRATGRYIGRAAKAKAPVYNGTDPRAQAESGNLKKSIKNAKRLIKLGPSDYSLKVGPFGSKKAGTAVTRSGAGKGQIRGVQLYRSAQELRYGYMAAGVAVAGSGEARSIYEAAYEKAFARFH